MADFSFKHIINGYEPKSGHGENFFSRGITGYMNKRHNKLVRAMAVAGDKMSETMAVTSTRSYGAFFISFGLLTLMIHYARDYLRGGGTVAPYVFILGMMFSLFSIPFLVFDKPISQAFSEFVLTDYIFFEFFCIKRIPLKPGAKGVNGIAALCLGVALAILTAFVPPWTVALGIGAAVYVFLTFTSPEFSYFLIFLCLPYFGLLAFGRYLLPVLVAVTLVSYGRKVLLGKRVYYFEQYDLIMIGLMGMILIAGVFMKGMDSFTGSLILITLSMGYVLTNSFCTNRRLADCICNAVVISAVPVSSVGVYRFIRSLIRHGLSGAEGQSVTFADSKTLALFLLVSAVLALYLSASHRSSGARALYTVLLLVICLGLVSTLEIWVGVTLIIGAVGGYAVNRMRRHPGLAVALLGLLPYALMAVPVGFMERISSLPVLSAFDLDLYALRWSNSIKIFRDFIMTGVGIGRDSFMTEYSAYDGPLFSDSGSFLLEVGVESGALALLLLLLLLAVRVRHLNKYRRYVEGSAVRLTSVFATVTVLCMIVFGATSYIWADTNMYYLFWCMMGMGSAALRISKTEYDDMIDYYSDGSSADSSSVDLPLAR